jgi:hypothetical protein
METKVEAPNTLDTTVNIDVAKQLVEVIQRSDRFALHPSKVYLPFSAIIILASKMLLHMNGVPQAEFMSQDEGTGANESRRFQ